MNLNENRISLIVWVPLTESTWKLFHQQEMGHSTGIYKGFKSLVLKSIANANYEFLCCDIGTNGRVSVGWVTENTKFYEKLLNEELNLSLPRKPDNGTSDLAYLFLGDEAFALRKDLLKSFSQKQLTNERSFFNCRLSRARRVIENTLGIMALRFRVSHTEINLKLENRNSCLVLLCSTQLFASLV